MGLSFRIVGLALAVLLASMGAAACGAPTSNNTVLADSTGRFVITGDPASAGGATWTFQGTVGGVVYDLAGVLYKPAGPGPFPAMLLSHGSQGSGAELAAGLAPTMVQWGLVCIAPNYTHSAGVPIGSPGTAADVGATPPNVLRAHMTHELLRRLGYVDMSRVGVHGHSAGAYVDVDAIAQYPSDFIVASHTGGGVRPIQIVAGPAPTVPEASVIRIPYQMHHGTADSTVALSYDQRLDSVLTATGTPHQLWTYEGETHIQVKLDPVMIGRLHDWYSANGLIP